MENIHNTASLAAITAHHQSRVTFERGPASLVCTIVDGLVDIEFKWHGVRQHLGMGYDCTDFDAIPFVQIFNTLPE